MQAAFIKSFVAATPFRRASATARPPCSFAPRLRRWCGATRMCVGATTPMKDMKIREEESHGGAKPDTMPIIRAIPPVVRRNFAVLVSLISPLLVCAVFMAVAEKWSFLEGLYFATTVATTVGYGDLHPTSRLTRTFVASYALFCAVRVGGVLASAVDGAARGVVKKAHSPDDIFDAERQGWARMRSTGLLVCVVFFSGWIFYTLSLGLHPIKAAYFVCITASTVGLGDVHPRSDVGRLFATGWLILAAVGFANFLSRYSDWRGLVRRRQDLNKVVSGKFCENSFASMDRDNTGKLEEAEFLGYSLVRIGAAREEEVKYILNRFKLMDQDQSGSLTFEEVKTADNNVDSDGCGSVDGR